MLKWIFTLGVASLIACGNCDRLEELKGLSSHTKHELPSDFKDKHLVLHFDVNGTLIASDSAKGMGAEKYVRRLMTNEIVLGDAAMSYNDWVHEKYPEDREAREKLFSGLGELIADQHYYSLYEEVITAMNDRLSGRTVFESFYSLIEALEEKGVSFTLHLRTFGHDITDVQREIERHTGITFDEQITAEGARWTLSDGRMIDDPGEMATLLQEKNCLVVDDYRYWSAHACAPGYGKLFPITDDPNVLEFFFDDNVTVDSEGVRSIVAPVAISENRVGYGIVDVRSAEAILDTSYFIDRLVPTLDTSSKLHEEAQGEMGVGHESVEQSAVGD